jgi:hypothetical protein
MNKQDLMNLSKEEVVEEYTKLENRLYHLIGKYAVLEARYEQQIEMNNMLVEKEIKKKILKKEGE